MGNEIEPYDFITFRTCFAMLAASTMATLWYMCWEPALRRMLKDSEEALQRAPSASWVASLNTAWIQFKLMVMLPLASWNLPWVMVYSMCTPTSMPMLLFRILFVMLIQVALVLSTLLIDLLTDGYNKIAIRLGCRKSHDTSSLELHGVGRAGGWAGPFAVPPFSIYPAFYCLEPRRLLAHVDR